MTCFHWEKLGARYMGIFITIAIHWSGGVPLKYLLELQCKDTWEINLDVVMIEKPHDGVNDFYFLFSGGLFYGGLYLYFELHSALLRLIHHRIHSWQCLRDHIGYRGLNPRWNPCNSSMNPCKMNALSTLGIMGLVIWEVREPRVSFHPFCPLYCDSKYTDTPIYT